MTKNTVLIVALLIYSAIVTTYVVMNNREYITDQQYKHISLQYLEDIRNELEVMNEINYENYILE